MPPCMPGPCYARNEYDSGHEDAGRNRIVRLQCGHKKISGASDCCDQSNHELAAIARPLWLPTDDTNKHASRPKSQDGEAEKHRNYDRCRLTRGADNEEDSKSDDRTHEQRS